MAWLSSFRDGIVNILSGQGTTADKRVHAYYALRLLDPAQIDAMYRSSWLMRKGVDLPPFDMTRAGRDWQAAKNVISALEAEEKRLQLWPKIRRALQLGRLGGGAMIIGAPGNPTDPLPASGRIEYLHVVSRYQITVGALISDPANPLFGQPSYWELNSGLARARLHPSRVIAFRGQPFSDMLGAPAGEDAFWGDSVLQAVADAVRNADMAQAGFASLIDEAKLDIIKIPQLTERAASPEYEAQLSARLTVAAAAKSAHRALILDALEEWDQRQINWSGMPDVIRTYLSIVAGAFDIPATRLLGKAPDGQNATGEHDERNYWTMIGSLQEAELRPALDRIDPLLKSAVGAPQDTWYDFSPLMVLSEKDRAEVNHRNAQSAQIYVNTGLIPERALAEGVQNRVIEDGLMPGLEDALDALPEDERYPSPPEPNDDVDPSAIQSLEPEGGDPASAGGGAAMPRRRAANDAAPRSLYIQRKLLNAAEFIEWAKSQGFETTTPAEDLHVTIAFSRKPVDWTKVGQAWGEDDQGQLTVRPGGMRLVEPLGDKGAIVLLFNSSELAYRHEDVKRAGAGWDWDSYQPHVTITYRKPEGLDLASVEPFRGELRFGPEIFEEVVEGWEKTLTES